MPLGRLRPSSTGYGVEPGEGHLRRIQSPSPARFARDLSPQAGRGKEGESRTPQAHIFLYASTIACPSAPAFFSQSCVSCSPTFLKPLASASLGGSTFMPLALSWSRYHCALSCHIFQPRGSAAAAAVRIASCVG